MNLCSDDHEEIAYEGWATICPACTIRTEKQGEVEEMEIEKNKEIARNLVIYSLTPFLLVSAVTGLMPFLYVIDILGFYCFYIFWVGAKEILVFPDNKQSSYILLTVVINFFVFSFLSITLSKLLEAYY